MTPQELDVGETHCGFDPDNLLDGPPNDEACSEREASADDADTGPNEKALLNLLS
jgi:hypothetical protein